MTTDDPNVNRKFLPNLIHNVIAQHVRIYGEDDTNATVDGTFGTNALVVADIIHNRIHRGQFFSVDFVNIALGNDEDMTIAVRVPEGSSAHVRLTSQVGGNSRQEFFRDSTFIADGTPIIPVNRNLFSDFVAETLFFHTPTVDTEGSILLDTVIAAGGGPHASGASTSSFEEYILVPGDYHYHVTNISGQTVPASMQIDFYENIIEQP